MAARQHNGSSLNNTTASIDATSEDDVTPNATVDVTPTTNAYNESENNGPSKQSKIINILDYLMKDNSYLMYDIFA